MLPPSWLYMPVRMRIKVDVLAHQRHYAALAQGELCVFQRRYARERLGDVLHFQYGFAHQIPSFASARINARFTLPHSVRRRIQHAVALRVRQMDAV